MIRIAIVDDHEMVREGLRAILQTEPDFDIVAESGSADRIVELAEQAQPDVVLLDARLPGVSGPDACRLLASSMPGTAVLIVSTYSDNELVNECITAGAKGYLIKDIERFSLNESIRAVHRGEGAVSPAIAGKVLDRLRDAAPADVPTDPPLSERQREILRLVAQGYSNREIAVNVTLSEHTVKSHIQEILRKLGLRNRVEAAIHAMRAGWL